MHNMIFDVYSGTWIFTTGDYDYQCRIIISTDAGDTWAEVASGASKFRLVNIVFDEDYAYYATDTNAEHALYRCARAAGTNIPDIANPELLTVLGYAEPTYRICLVRNPSGLLMLDRGETRTDLSLDLMFWSFDKERLYRLGAFSEIQPATGNRDGVFGFGNQTVTQYQPTSEGGIICGATSLNKTTDVEILGNTITKLLGNVKIKVVQLKN
jgi:hypothetical protein